MLSIYSLIATGVLSGAVLLVGAEACVGDCPAQGAPAAPGRALLQQKQKLERQHVEHQVVSKHEHESKEHTHMKIKEAATAATTSNACCSWEIAYDVWFGGGSQEVVYSLEQCCADQSCVGLAWHSSMQWQAYKFTSLPGSLPSSRVPLEAFNTALPTRWSFFVKSGLCTTTTTTTIKASSCMARCQSAGYCCNDPGRGSNQFLSCAQACKIRASGATLQVCKSACDEPRSCSRTVNGLTFGMCSTCIDKTPQCPYGVQSVDECYVGCSEVPEPTGPLCHVHFINGDNNLDVFAGLDMSELSSNPTLTAGLAAGFRSFAVVDRISDTAKRWQLIDSSGWQEMEDLGELDMGSKTTVTASLKWGISQCKASGANLFMLSYWDHGGGITGLGGDSNAPSGGHGVGTSMKDYADAVAETLTSEGVSPDNVMLGFDACLMSQFGPIASLKNQASGEWLARYLVASESVEPGYGWTYSHFNLTATNLATYGASIVDAFMMGGSQSPLTLALIDLHKWTPFWAAFGEVLSAIDFSEAGAKSKVSLARQNCKNFEGAWSENDPDVGDFLKELKAAYSGTTTACIDEPTGWYDADGATYNCNWYLAHTACAPYGSEYENFGKTANQACCVCGGGASISTAPLPALVSKIDTASSLLSDMVVHFAHDDTKSTGIASFFVTGSLQSYKNMGSTFADLTQWTDFLEALQAASLLDMRSNGGSTSTLEGGLSVYAFPDKTDLMNAKLTLTGEVDNIATVTIQACNTTLKPYVSVSEGKLVAVASWDAKDAELGDDVVYSTELNPGSCNVDGCEYAVLCQYKKQGPKLNATLEQREKGSAVLYAYEADLPGEVRRDIGGRVRCKSADGWTSWKAWASVSTARRHPTGTCGITATYCTENDASCTSVSCMPDEPCWTLVTHMSEH